MYLVEILLLPQFISLMLSWLTAQIATEEEKGDSIPKQFLKDPVDLTRDRKFLVNSKSVDWYLLYVGTTCAEPPQRILSASS